MADPDLAPQPEAAHVVPGPRDLAVVASLSAVVLTLFALRPAVGSEFRYLEASRAMALGGDWIVPHLAGVPYMEKPILFYWLSAGFQWLFGVSLITARAPSILGATTMLTVAYALAAEWRGRDFGRATAMLMAGSLVFIPTVTTASTDPLFAGTLALAWYALWRRLRGSSSAWAWILWTALAAAMLTKGPLGPALFASSCLVLAVLTRNLAWVRQLKPVAGGLLFVALCAPWHVLSWRLDPRLLEFFYIRQNVQALLDDSVNHKGPIWFYAPVVLILFFPWSLLAIPALFRAAAALVESWFSRARQPTRFDVYLGSVVFGPLLLLSASASKLSSYVMPLLPFLAILIAREGARALQRRGGFLRVAAWTPVVCLVVALIALGPRLLEHRYLPLFTSPPVLTAIALILITLLAGAVLAQRGRAACVAVTTAGCLLAMGIVSLQPLPAAAAIDGRAAAALVSEARSDHDLIIVQSRDAQDYSINMALPGTIYLLGRARELGFGHFVATRGPEHDLPADPYDIRPTTLPDDPLLLSRADLQTRWDGPERVWLFGREKDVTPLRADPTRGVHTFYDDGHIAVYTNRPIPTAGPSAGQ